jgi:dihydroorotase
MNILLRRARIIDPLSKYHQKVVNIEIRNGKISRIGKTLKTDQIKEIDLQEACVSPGWVDIGTQVGEPGFEHRENLKSISKVACAGGYTRIAPFPNTSPSIDSKSQVAFFVNASNDLPIYLHPIGAISKDTKGKDLAELTDMHHSGAVAFSDGEHSIDKSGLFLRALDYVKPFNGLIIDHAIDSSIQPEGQVHEGDVSTQMGLKGQPTLAEVIQIRKNLDLLEYAQSKLLLHLISSKEGVDEVKKGKKRGLNVGGTVSAHHLCFTDEAVSGFDPLYKVNPPLRETKDRKALTKGLQKGHLDIIVSNHIPLDPEEKVMAFSDATPGMINLQTTFSMLRTFGDDDLSVDDLVQGMAIGPREWLGLPAATIDTEQLAELTIFDPDAEFVFDLKANQSRSSNSPLLGKTLKGKVLGTYCKGKLNWQT